MDHHDQHHVLIHRLFPFLSWLKGYEISAFRKDLVSGLTVAVVLIPQSMAYAMLAGLPPVYGLYAAATAPLIAALWGSLRQLSTGPIAITSLLVLTTLAPLAEPGSPRYIGLALVLAFLVGLLYLGIGIFRLGMVMSFISHSAIRGFTSAAALIIIATQLPHLLGIKTQHAEYIFQMLRDLAMALPSLHPPTLLLGVIAFGIIFGIQRVRRNLPAGLIALLATTIPIWLFELHLSGINVVGASPGGLPGFSLPDLGLDTLSSLLGPAFVIAMVSFAETYSVGKSISIETKQKVDVNQEFIGQGLANLVGSFFQGYPVSGSLSRTAINFATGARTGMSSVVAGVCVILALLFLTPLFTYIPRAALAALVISAVLLLFHPKEVFLLWRMNRHDGIVAWTVFVLALLTKPDYALLLGVMMSLMFFLWKTMHPRIVRVTKDPELNMFLNADVYGKPSCPQILELRSDNCIFFGNAEYTMEQILHRLDEQATPLRFLVLDFEAIGFVDISAVDEFRLLLDELERKGVKLVFLSVRLPVREVLKSTGFINEFGAHHVFDKRGDVISTLFPQLDHKYCKEVCPHSLFLECARVK